MGSRDKTYVSDFTRFINEFLEEHPEEAVEQRRGRAIYWDRKVDFEAWKEAQEDTVPVDSYYYYGNPWPGEQAQSVGEKSAAPPAK